MAAPVTGSLHHQLRGSRGAVVPADAPQRAEGVLGTGAGIANGRGEVPGCDQLLDRGARHQHVEHVAQAAPVQALRGGRDAQHPGSRQALQHLAPGAGNGMVGLVDHDQVVLEHQRGRTDRVWTAATVISGSRFAALPATM